MMKAEALPYLAFCRGRMDDKAVERAVNALADKAKRDEFFGFFKTLETFYEIISPDPLLRDYMNDYARLCRLYQVVRASLTKQEEVPDRLSGSVRVVSSAVVQKQLAEAGTDGAPKQAAR